MEPIVYQKILYLLESRKIPIDKFLSDLNIPKEKFKAWENGFELTSEELVKVSNYFGVTYDYMLSPNISVKRNKNVTQTYDQTSQEENVDINNDNLHRSFLSSFFGGSYKTSKGRKATAVISYIIVLIVLIAIFISFFENGATDFFQTPLGTVLVIGIAIMLLIAVIKLVFTIIKIIKRK